jgi:hypothetical protein
MPSLQTSNPLPSPKKGEEDIDFTHWPRAAIERAIDLLIETDRSPDGWPSLFLSVNPQSQGS